MQNERIKVLFIGSLPRSGSTLLDRILGNVPGFVSTGELRRIWDRGLGRNHLCGCAMPLKTCAFWSEVLKTSLDWPDSFNLLEVQNIKNQIERTRHIYRYFLHLEKQGSYGAQFEKYAAVMSNLYKGIAIVSGKNVIVDSSKVPIHGFILSRIPSLDVYFIHLVRDSRAVAFSMRRKKDMPIGLNKATRMANKSSFGSAIDWNLQNTLLRFLNTSKNRRMMVRYEDLSDNPRTELIRILKWIGEPQEKADFLKDTSIEFQTNHTVSGNPMRFTTGATEIRRDTEWRSSKNSERGLVTALTLPLLIAFGYPVLTTRS